MGFIEDDDGAGDAVEFATAGGAVGVEGFEKLDVGGDDDAGIPVFGSEAVGGGFVLGVWVEIGVMF